MTVPSLDDTPITVVHYLNRLMPSGLERMLEASSRHFAAEGVRTIVVGQGRDHVYTAALREAGLDVRELAPVSTWRGALEWARLVRVTKPDIVHLHSESSFLLPALIATAASRRASLVRTVHSVFDHTGPRGRLRSWRNAVADMLVSHIVVGSPAIRDAESGRRPEASLVWNWVEDRYTVAQPSEAVPWAERGAAVALVGNCSRIKNHEAVLVALPSSGVAVAHIGREDAASERERRLLDDLEAEGACVARFSGDPYPVLRRSRALAMPSLVEGMSLAVIEGLCAGVRVLVSDVPELRWAERFGATRVSGGDWRAALQHAMSSPPDPVLVGDARAAFSASRGVAEHLAIYRRARAAAGTSSGRAERHR